MFDYRWIREKALFMVFIIIFSIFSIYLIKPVEAAESNKVCCEKTKDGRSCVEADKSQCDSNFESPAIQCVQTNFCKSGCCVSSTGSCAKNTEKSTCDKENGAWYPNVNC